MGIGSHDYGGWEVPCCWSPMKDGGPKHSSEDPGGWRPKNQLWCPTSAGRRWYGSQLEKRGEFTFLCLFILFSPQRVRCYWPTLAKAILFTQLTDSNANLFQRHLTDTPRNMFHQLSKHPLAQSSWHFKLTISDMNGNIGSLWVFSLSAGLLYRFWIYQTP